MTTFLENSLSVIVLVKNVSLTNLSVTKSCVKTVKRVVKKFERNNIL